MSSHVLRLTLLLSAVSFVAAAPAFAIQGEVSAITYEDADGDRRIFAFARGDNGHLVLNHFDGTTWQWIDHGLPAGATSISSPRALTYVDSSGNRRIYVFAKNNSTRLVVRYWNGFQWQWANQGGPELLGNTLSVLTYIDPSGNRRIYAFAVGGDQDHLVTNYWDGVTWQWADQGGGPGGKVTSTEAITYLDDNGQRRIDVFCRGGLSTGFPLYVNSWTGSSWIWAIHGGSNVRMVSAYSYVDTAGHRRIYAFMDRDNEMWVRWWDGFSWAWKALGMPLGEENSILYNISALTYLDGSIRRHQAFVEVSGKLFVKYWNGLGWNWANQSLPAGHTNIQSPSALTFLESRGNPFIGTQWIYVFAMGSGGNLVINYWDGDSWQWIDNGTL
jgi:hypothetical protein